MDGVNLSFPKNFIFGTATSAYQIEGAWNEDGKGESIWDRFCHDKMGKVRHDADADVTIDHYHRFESDLDLLKSLNCGMYRFSLAWTRILPDGTGKINQKGIDFYNKIIDGLLERGIEPAITLFHWDYPVKLQDKGGWANKESVNWFLEYADVCFKAFGDRVKYWITLNEISVFTFLGYGSGLIPPCVRDFKTAVQAAHNAMVAHGKAVQLYRKTGQGGKIGVALDLVPKVPVSDKREDIEATDIANSTTQFFFYDAIIKGKYPETALRVFKEHGYMPDIDLEELKVISEKCDFLGVNYYLTQGCRYKESENRFGYEIVPRDMGKSDMVCGKGDVDPVGCYDLLMKIKKDTKGLLPVMITENGYASPKDTVTFEEETDDGERIEYLEGHLGAISDAIEDGVPVVGYIYWSAFDNFEWRWGYDKRFGLFYVDYDTQERIEKKSTAWFRKITERRG